MLLPQDRSGFEDVPFTDADTVVMQNKLLEIK